MTVPSVIQVLDATTANKIAAGEVVERPASVIKELVENALDAESSRIEIEINEGGLDYIRVTDNGYGMSPKDAQLSVLRHATSKIRTADDLHHIGTLGFRGEALPSIASVSKFSLTTRLETDQFATYLEIHGGNVIEVREAGANSGTTVIVRELFFNTPARRKFLKTTATESSYIHSILGKLALSNPNVAFQFINNGRQVLATPGNGDLLETMACLYGHNLLKEVLPVSFQDSALSIEGYVAKPTLLKSSRQWQTFIVNKRVVNSRIIAKALDSAYHSLLPKAGYPLATIHIHIPLENIDVNVHPQKSEIKFSDDQLLYRLVYKAVGEAIQKPDSLTQAATAVHHNDFAYKNTVESRPSVIARPALWQEEALPFHAAQAVLKKMDTELSTSLPAPALTCPVHDLPSRADTDTNREVLQPLGQFDNCYIIARGADGLYIVDQHAAHERILYDRFVKNTDRIPVQQLLVPLYLDFDAQEISLIERSIELFYAVGISIDIAGPSTIRVSEFPADLSATIGEEIIRECLRMIGEEKNPTAQILRHKFLQMAACRSAIKAGDGLNMRQIHALLNELCTTDLPYTCPHGRPAIIKFTHADLEKMFKRT